MKFLDTTADPASPERAVNEMVALLVGFSLLGALLGHVLLPPFGSIVGFLIGIGIGTPVGIARKKLFRTRLKNR